MYDTTLTPTSEPQTEAWRVAVLVRELRRAAGSQRFRRYVYGPGEPLDPGQHDALDVVVRLGKARMHELADLLRVDRSTATRTVERLEHLGLVARRPDPTDQRFVVVVATAKGRHRHQSLAERARRSFDALFQRYDTAQLKAFGDLLERLVADIDQLIGESARQDRTTERRR